MSTPCSRAARIDSSIAARAVPPGGARRRDDRRRIAEPLRERRAQEPLGHRRATDVPRADDQDPAHDEGRESSNAGSSGRSSAIAVTGRATPRGGSSRARARDPRPWTRPLRVDRPGTGRRRRPPRTATWSSSQVSAGGWPERFALVTASGPVPGEDHERERMVRGADADGRRVATEVPPEGVLAPREDEREGTGPAGRDEALRSLVEHGDRPRGRRGRDQHRELELPRADASPRTPARWPRDRPDASPTRRRCRSGTRSARLAGLRPSHHRADR